MNMKNDLIAKVQDRGDVLAVTLSESVDKNLIEKIAESEKEVIGAEVRFLIKRNDSNALSRLKALDESAANAVTAHLKEASKADPTDLDGRAGSEDDANKDEDKDKDKKVDESDDDEKDEDKKDKDSDDDNDSDDDDNDSDDDDKDTKDSDDDKKPKSKDELKVNEAEDKDKDEKKSEDKSKDKDDDDDSDDEDEDANESIEVSGARRELKKIIRTFEGVKLDPIAGSELFSITYPVKLRESITKELSAFFSAPGIHIVKESAGKSLYRVMVETGFAGDNIKVMSAIFEAAVAERTANFETEFETRVTEEVARQVDDIVDSVDAVVAESASDWFVENKVAISSDLRLAKAEELFESVKVLFANAGFKVPENKMNHYDVLVEENKTLKSQLESNTKKFDVLKEEIDDLKRDQMLNKIAEDHNLSAAQKDRLTLMLEGVKVSDVETKSELLIESFFAESKSKPSEKFTASGDVINESVVNQVDTKKPVDPVKEQLRRMNRANVTFS